MCKHVQSRWANVCTNFATNQWSWNQRHASSNTKHFFSNWTLSEAVRRDQGQDPIPCLAPCHCWQDMCSWNYKQVLWSLPCSIAMFDVVFHQSVEANDTKSFLAHTKDFQQLTTVPLQCIRLHKNNITLCSLTSSVQVQLWTGVDVFVLGISKEILHKALQALRCFS